MRSNYADLNQVTSLSDLTNQIERLSLRKEMQEEMLKETMKALSHSVQPNVMLKKALSTLSRDDELKQNTLQAGLNFGSRFLLDKILLGSGVGLKKYLLNIALKKVASFLISRNTAPSSGK
ncbi:MAG: hypothetical protein V4590_06555 [Bacteroidota bacterium]